MKPQIMQATPASWLQLLDSGWNGSDGLINLISTGEALPRLLAGRMLEASEVICDLYGPTETTIWSTKRRLQQHRSNWGSIGRPLANTQVYVVDANIQPVPIGVPGELYIGGAGLARGYLNRPELTAEKFVRNPFSDDPTARLYRTGDLCRWRADGNLEYLGRIDNQVKLRGFRIELGEIENVLNAHAKINQCVVMLREDRAGDKRLVAYCVPAEGKLHVSELRSYLQGRLPDYMLPSSFVELTSFPLTSSGKLDRRSLPAPDDSRPDLESGYVAPRNPLEEQLASIWGELLGLQAIGVHDNFFALGGHSLLATSVVARASAALQVDLPLRRIFRNAFDCRTCRRGGATAERWSKSRTIRAHSR